MVNRQRHSHDFIGVLKFNGFWRRVYWLGYGRIAFDRRLWFTQREAMSERYTSTPLPSLPSETMMRLELTPPNESLIFESPIFDR